MMSSMRGAASGGRAPRRGKGKSANSQYVIIAAVGVGVIVAAVLLLGGTKPAAKPSSKKTTSAEVKSRKTVAKPKPAAVVATRDPRDARREERSRRRDEARAERREKGSRRSRSGGYSGGGRASYNPNMLRAIITDEGGSRMALVGEKRLKPGDELEGRKVTEVGPDAIKVEYRQSQYTVRVGGSIY